MLLFISSSLQSPAMYQVQMPHMTVSQSKPYRAGKGEKNHISSHFALTSINLQIDICSEKLTSDCGWISTSRKCSCGGWSVVSQAYACQTHWSSVSSSQHAPAEVRPASPCRHANHDASSNCSRTPDCSTEPGLPCPVLHLQPAAVRQSAAGPADDALPVTSRISCATPVCFCTFGDMEDMEAMQSLGCHQRWQSLSPSAVQSSAICLARSLQTAAWRRASAAESCLLRPDGSFPDMVSAGFG